MKAIVTGGAGFIGSHIVDSLIDRGVETYVIDNFTTGSLDNLTQHANRKLLHLVRGDIKDIHKLMPEIKDVDILFHQSAIASVVASIENPLLVNDVNVTSTLKVMDYCIKQGIKRFVFASSGAVYGVVGNVPISEDFLCSPNTPYAAGKLACENYLQAYHSTYGLETVMLRYFNVYGTRQAFTEDSVVINTFTNKLVNNETPVIYGNGLQTRDFVNVSDIAQANMAALEKTDIASESFNIASGKSYSLNEILFTLKQITGTEHIQHKYAASRKGDVMFAKVSIKKATDKLGYMPKISLYEGLKQVVEFTRNKGQTSSNERILVKQFNQEKDKKI